MTRIFLLAAALLLAPFEPALANAQADRSPITVPEQLLTDLQEDFDLPAVAAAAIAGNLAQESGNFRMLHEIGGGCYGYSQWCGSRKRAFRAYAVSVGDQQSYAANYGFLAHELSTEYQGMLSRLRRTQDVDIAARIFMREFLRPAARTANLPRRIRFAKKFLSDDFSGAGCYSHFRLEGRDKPAPCPGDA